MKSTVCANTCCQLTLNRRFAACAAQHNCPSQHSWQLPESANLPDRYFCAATGATLHCSIWLGLQLQHLPATADACCLHYWCSSCDVGSFHAEPLPGACCTGLVFFWNFLCLLEQLLEILLLLLLLLRCCYSCDVKPYCSCFGMSSAVYEA